MVIYIYIYINMGETKMNHPFGNGNHTVPPIYGDDWGRVYYCFTHVIALKSDVLL